ncbi:Bestrophin-4 Vitelliform macular dystrophy 2-like protein 2 [Collichthys lucidus]|uniref:Bestrophin homolog n=1 Tax=Collichthys lucidus TaxID=240159 RepID=A0A4U5UW02_COLLU|nr:Bestrophin-4 Vitelliform macular dystrophy 2-like protein 2 [Collichthys lucidus]
MSAQDQVIHLTSGLNRSKRSHDHLLHPQSSRCQILWLLQTPVQVEGKHLQAGLQRAAGVLWRLSVFQPVLQVNELIYCLLQCDQSFMMKKIKFYYLHRLMLTTRQQDMFERVALYCDQFTNTNFIPVLFVLGFYVTLAFNRWWGQYTSFPLPDNLMMVVSGNVHGVDERGRLLRRTLMRYANLSSVLILRSISTRVLKRFPTLEHIVEAGFMTTHELKLFESLHSDFNKYWMPLTWFSNLASIARKEGRVRDDIALRLLMDVVTIAVYSFFAFCVIGRQFLNPEKGYRNHNMDLYVPVFTLLQFFFYAGWLKVGELIINPFGEDDDDFETNQLIDRNIEVSMLAVDDMYQNLAPIVKDKHWAQRHFSIPYTLSTAAETLRPAFKGSTFDMRMSVEDLEIHQPGDSPGKKQYLPLRASLGDGLDSLLQRGKGILRGGSLPSLVDVSAHPNEEDDTEDEVNASNHKEQTFINVVVEQV